MFDKKKKNERRNWLSVCVDIIKLPYTIVKEFFKWGVVDTVKSADYREQIKKGYSNAGQSTKEVFDMINESSKKSDKPCISWNESVLKSGITLAELNKSYKISAIQFYVLLAVSITIFCLVASYVPNNLYGVFLFISSIPFIVAMLLSAVRSSWTAWRYKNKTEADFNEYLKEFDVFPNPFYEINSLYREEK